MEDTSVPLEQGSLAPGGLRLLAAALVSVALLSAFALMCSRRLIQGAAAVSTAVLSVPRECVRELCVATLYLAIAQTSGLFALAWLLQRSVALVADQQRPGPGEARS